MRITVGNKDIKVTSLGRWYTPSSAAKHNFLIAATDGELILDIGKAVADAAQGTEEGFVYGDIEGGVILKANTSYYIISDYWGEDDKFYSASAQVTTKAATLDGIVILNASNEYEYYEAAGTGWGPLTFKYVSDTPETGDTVNLTFYAATASVSALLFALLAVAAKKRFSVDS